MPMFEGLQEPRFGNRATHVTLPACGSVLVGGGDRRQRGHPFYSDGDRDPSKRHQIGLRYAT